MNPKKERKSHDESYNKAVLFFLLLPGRKEEEQRTTNTYELKTTKAKTKKREKTNRYVFVFSMYVVVLCIF